MQPKILKEEEKESSAHAKRSLSVIVKVVKGVEGGKER